MKLKKGQLVIFHNDDHSWGDPGTFPIIRLHKTLKDAKSGRRGTLLEDERLFKTPLKIIDWDDNGAYFQLIWEGQICYTYDDLSCVMEGSGIKLYKPKGIK
jgi:hypothetical protein